MRLFRTLLANGFCKSEDDDETDSCREGGARRGNMHFEDDVEGTGMGEGEGKKDVSDQIEDEEQLLGLKGDEQMGDMLEKKEYPKREKNKEEGLEMQNDFQGKIEDCGDDENEGRNDESDDDNEEELDREMDDFDQDNIVDVDEKRWGGDSDDGDEKIDKSKEKFDEKEMKGGDALEDEIRLRRDGQERKGKGG